MKGYCNKGILVLPKKETIDARAPIFRKNLITSVENLIKFFESIDIKLYCFTTNEGLQELYRELPKMNMYSITPMEDEFFINKYCNISSIKLEGERPVNYDIYVDEARKKMPTKGITDKYAKFDVIVKREKYIANKILSEKDTKLVINMEKGNNGCYKIVPTAKSKKIIVNVSIPDFTVSSTVSDMPIGNSYVFGKNNKIQFLYNWEVQEYGK